MQAGSFLGADHRHRGFQTATSKSRGGRSERARSSSVRHSALPQHEQKIAYPHARKNNAAVEGASRFSFVGFAWRTRQPLPGHGHRGRRRGVAWARGTGPAPLSVSSAIPQPEKRCRGYVQVDGDVVRRHVTASISNKRHRAGTEGCAFRLRDRPRYGRSRLASGTWPHNRRPDLMLRAPPAQTVSATRQSSASCRASFGSSSA